MGLKTNRRGSLTVEAAIILPLFLCFFFFMVFVIKAACIHISLDHAVQETAKEIAASAYPLSLINEMVDELEIKEDADVVSTASGERLLAELIAGEIDGEGLQKILTELGSREFVEHIGYGQKKQLQERIVTALLKKNLTGSYVNPEEVYLSLVDFPQSEWEYEENRKAGGDYDQNYRKAGLQPEQDFGKDDVVIQLEYKLTVPFAFLESWQITLRHAAVEKAWLNGGNGVYSDRQDRGIFEQKPEEEIVYVTRTGIKYHLEGCRYLQKSKIPISLEEAQKSYGPCKICRPKR